MRIVGVEHPCRRPRELAAFYRDALGFGIVADDGDGAHVRLTLGEFSLRLRRADGRAVPGDMRADDGRFRHLAICVRDVDAAFEFARANGARFVSAPVRLPDWNSATTGLRAAYLRGPESHYVEIVEFGARAPDVPAPLFYGVDHTAIVVGDVERAIVFYRDRLALEVVARSHNFGPEQSRLSGLPRADVDIVSLRGRGGFGIELLAHRRRSVDCEQPADTTDADLWSAATLVDGPFATDDGASVVRDPDGHRVRYVTN